MIVMDCVLGNKMKIFLVDIVENKNTIVNLGLGYIYTSLLNDSNNVIKKRYSLSDNIDAENVVNDLLSEKPDIIGFSITSASLKSIFKFSRIIKQIDPSIKIILGGPSLVDKFIKIQIANTEYFDFIIEGDSEVGVLEATRLVKKNKDIKFLSFNILINDINKIQFPEFIGYEIKNSGHPSILPITTSRGCIGRCTFCSEKLFWRKYRKRKIDNIINEIIYQRSKHKINHFWFTDSLINADMQHLIDLCNELERKGIKIIWGGNARIDKNFTKTNCEILYNAGCRYLRLGIESGSQKVIDHMRKDIVINDAPNILSNIYSSNIYTHLYFIVGYPTETDEDFNETVYFIKNNYNKINSFFVHGFTYIPSLIDDNHVFNKIQFLPNELIEKRLRILNSFDKSNTKKLFYVDFLRRKDLFNFKN